MNTELIAEAKALCEIDYCYGDADRDAKERRVWALIGKLAKAEPTFSIQQVTEAAVYAEVGDGQFQSMLIALGTLTIGSETC